MFPVYGEFNEYKTNPWNNLDDIFKVIEFSLEKLHTLRELFQAKTDLTCSQQLIELGHMNIGEVGQCKFFEISGKEITKLQLDGLLEAYIRENNL